jgi:hypothetical protein
MKNTKLLLAGISIVLLAGCTKPTIDSVCKKLQQAGVAKDCIEDKQAKASLLRYGPDMTAGSFNDYVSEEADGMIVIAPSDTGHLEELAEKFASGGAYLNKKARILIIKAIDRTPDEPNKIGAVVHSF